VGIGETIFISNLEESILERVLKNDGLGRNLEV
jgi:hypothetical protein